MKESPFSKNKQDLEREYYRSMQNQSVLADKREGVIPQKLGELNKELGDLKIHWNELRERLGCITRSIPEKDNELIPTPPQIVPLAEPIEDALRCVRHLSVELNDVLANLEL